MLDHSLLGAAGQRGEGVDEAGQRPAASAI
jgi:hypothetical protein